MSNRKIVVLGGSFNPPTIAHRLILEATIDKLQADIGLFVPSSHNYVARKMRKQNKEYQTLPESVRVSMLNKMCEHDNRLQVNNCELGDDGRGHTYDTLVQIQKEYTNDLIYFIVGYDNIRMIPRWHSKEDLVKSFRFAVLSRNGLDVQPELNKYPLLTKYSDHFIQVESPSGIDNISSTIIRQGMENKDYEQIKKLVDPLAFDILISNKHYFVGRK